MAIEMLPPPLAQARYFAVLCDFLDSIGISGDDVLTSAGIGNRKSCDTDRLLTLPQVELLLESAMKRSGRSDLAFELGRRIQLHSHGELSFALMTCATLDDMFRLFERFYGLITPICTMRYERHDDKAELVFCASLPMSATTRLFWLEATAVAMVGQIASGLQGGTGVCDIFMPMPPPLHVARFSEMANANFHFGRTQHSELRILLRGANLDARLSGGNATLSGLAENRCEALLRRIGARLSWSDWVEQILREWKEKLPTSKEFAASLNVTDRTLHRRLIREGASFRDIVGQLRTVRARELLDGGAMAVSEIAYTLGYSDIASFSRSFKRLNGVSPSLYRAKNNTKETGYAPHDARQRLT